MLGESRVRRLFFAGKASSVGALSRSVRVALSDVPNLSQLEPKVTFTARTKGYDRLAFLFLQLADVPHAEAPAVHGLAAWQVSWASLFQEWEWL